MSTQVKAPRIAMAHTARSVKGAPVAGAFVVLGVFVLLGVLACAESTNPMQGERDSGSSLMADAQAPMTDAQASLTDAQVVTDAATDLGSDLCRADSECALTDNCCECSVGLAASEVGECTVSCEQTQCAQWELTEADVSCETGRLGRSRCAVKRAAAPRCGPLNTVDARERCEAGPPECPSRSVAELDDTGTCWSGRCVPANLCQSVDGCAQCQDDEVCVADVATGAGIMIGEADPDGEFEEIDRVTFACEPASPTCEDESNCECESDFCRNGDCLLGPFSGWPYDTGVGNLVELSEGALICRQYDG